MTVGELRQALASFDAEQYVCVLLMGSAADGVAPNGVQVILQGVKEFPPWYPAPGVPDLVGLLADARNRELKSPR